MDLKGTDLNMINSTFLARVSDKNANDYNVQKEKKFLEQAYKFQNKNKCSFFQFLTLYKGEGLAEADGILGLAP